MSLSETDRARLAEFARVMIPGGAGQPSAEEVDLANAPVADVLRIDPSRVGPVAAFLSLTGDIGTLGDVERLAQSDPDGFQALSVVLATAYFMHPKVRDAIGYRGQEARDSSVGLTDDDLKMVAEVTHRGPVFRDADI